MKNNKELGILGSRWLDNNLGKCKVENAVHKNCKRIKNIIFIEQTNKETKSIETIDLNKGEYYDIAKLADIAVNTDNTLEDKYDIIGVGELFEVVLIQVRSV